MLSENFVYATISTPPLMRCEYCLCRTAVAALAFGHGEDQESFWICLPCLDAWKARVKAADSLEELRPNFI